MNVCFFSKSSSYGLSVPIQESARFSIYWTLRLCLLYLVRDDAFRMFTSVCDLGCIIKWVLIGTKSLKSAVLCSKYYKTKNKVCSSDWFYMIAEKMTQCGRRVLSRILRYWFYLLLTLIILAWGYVSMYKYKLFELKITRELDQRYIFWYHLISVCGRNS